MGPNTEVLPQSLRPMPLLTALCLLPFHAATVQAGTNGAAVRHEIPGKLTCTGARALVAHLLSFHVREPVTREGNAPGQAPKTDTP